MCFSWVDSTFWKNPHRALELGNSMPGMQFNTTLERARVKEQSRNISCRNYDDHPGATSLSYFVDIVEPHYPSATSFLNRVKGNKVQEI